MTIKQMKEFFAAYDEDQEVVITDVTPRNFSVTVKAKEVKAEEVVAEPVAEPVVEAPKE